MKILITYYSRTNITKKVAEKIQKNLDCDIEEIIDLKNRSGLLGWIKSLLDGIKQRPTNIKQLKKSPSDYDLVIIGTPIWADTMTSAVLTYLQENKEKFKDVSYFCTCRSSGYDETFGKMEEITGKKGVGTLALTKKDLDTSFDSKIRSYTEKIKQT